MKKILILLILMISLTGCEAVYNLDINNNTFTEELVLTTNDKSSKSQKTVNVALKSKIPVDDNYYKPEVNFKQNNLKYYQISKIDTDNELGARYKANLTKEEYLTSTLVKEHFPNFKLNESGNIISLNLGKKENIFDNYPDLDKLTIKPTNTNVSGAMIAAGFNALVNFGGRIILFSANSCFKGYLSTKIPSSIKVNGKEEDLNSSKEIEEMILKCNKNKIGIDQYIVIDTANKSNYNIYQPNYERYIQNFSRLSNETGGKVSIYPIDYNNLNTITNSTYEKVYYDLSSILTSNTFYDVKVMLRHSQEITCQEILGGFDKKVGEAFELAVADSDFSVGYFFRYSNSLKIGQTVDIQIAVAYYDSFGSEKMRIYNYTLTSTDDVNKLYLSCDVDAMAKMTIMKTISKYPIYPQQVSENQPDVISLVGDYLYKKYYHLLNIIDMKEQLIRTLPN